MLLGAMFVGDLRRSSRKRGDSAIRVAVGLWFLVILTVQYLGWRAEVKVPTQEQVASFARSMLETFVVGQGLALAAITPAIVGGTFAEMRARKTLDLLLCTHASAWDLVGGFFMARLLRVLSFLMISLPIQCMICVFGGIDASIVLIALGVTASLLALVAACSLVASLLSGSTGEAVAFSYAVTVAWLGLSPLIEGPLRGSWPALYTWLRPVTYLLASVNPIASFDRSAVAWMRLSGMWLGLSLMLTACVALAFRSIAKREDYDSRRTARSRRRPHVSESPMSWKERYAPSVSARLTRAGSRISLLSLILLAILTVRFLLRIYFKPAAASGRISDLIDFLRFLRVTTSCLISLGLAVAATHAASSITFERERTTWLSLLACPLDGPEILAAKRLGALARIRGIECALLVLWLSGVLGGVLPIASCVISIAITWVAFRFAAALGVLVSLHSNSSSRSLMVALLILLIIQGGYLLCCVPIPGLSSVVLFGCTPLLNELSLTGSGLIPATVRFLPARLYQELPFTALVSVIVYRLGTLAVNLIAEIGFDHAVDRPTRSASRSS